MAAILPRGIWVITIFIQYDDLVPLRVHVVLSPDGFFYILQCIHFYFQERIIIKR